MGIWIVRLTLVKRSPALGLHLAPDFLDPILLFGSTVAERLDLLPYAHPMPPSALAEGRPHTTWILSLGAIPMLASSLILGIFAYVTAEWQDRERRLKEACKTDYLTGVHNRRSFMDHGDREFSRAQRYRKPLTVVMVDVDRFKSVNDNHGHAVGNELRKLVAKSAAIKSVILGPSTRG